jgi:hypothetical protein
MTTSPLCGREGLKFTRRITLSKRKSAAIFGRPRRLQSLKSPEKHTSHTSRQHGNNSAFLRPLNQFSFSFYSFLLFRQMASATAPSAPAAAPSSSSSSVPSLSFPLSSSSSSASSTSAATAVFKAHVAERDARKQRLDKAVEQALVIADDLENNCRAALGIQLNTAVQNQQRLEAAVKGLRTQVAALGKTCTSYGAQYDALVAAVAELGSMENYLRSTDGNLARVVDNLEFVAGRLASEE